MHIVFSTASEADFDELTALHKAEAEDLTRRFGLGPWRPHTPERRALRGLPQVRLVTARLDGSIAGVFKLQTKKPWAIDVSYFTPVPKAIYLTGLAVHPGWQGKGIGRLLLAEAARQVLAWPADAIRLDAYNMPGGAGDFYAKCSFCEVGRVVYRNTPLIYFERVLSAGDIKG